MLAAVRTYAAFCASKDKVGTEFVLMARTFFGTSGRWHDFMNGEPTTKEKKVEQERTYDVPEWQKARPKDWKAPK